MAIVKIVEKLYSQIEKKFKDRCIEVFEHIKSLEQNPHKGKTFGTVGGILIKELKFEGFRFYFITNGYILKCLDKTLLTDLLIKFVRMSNKKEQQKVIDEIRQVLLKIGPDGF